MGMGRPLQSGIYYVGVINATGTNALSYKIKSRFIGDGESISVTNLDYANGVVTNFALAPREAAYYRVVIPPSTPSWKVRLTPLSGEVMLVVSTNRIPNLESEKRVQKLGKEHYVLLPKQGQDYLPEGLNYLVVIGEGISPASSTRIGAGDSSYVLESLGATPEISMGTLDGEIIRPDTLEGGESRAYHFSTLPGSLGFEIYVEDSVGNPTAVSRGSWELADPGLGVTGVPADLYGNEGGQTDGSVASSFKIEVANPFPQETIMVKARALGNLFPDASYTLRVKEKVPELLTFDAGITSVTNQSGDSWRYFRVDVPANALGWDVRLTNVLSGSPKISVGRDILPISLTTTLGFTPATSTNWPSGVWWAAAKDWTERSFSADAETIEDGRVLAMGMNRPLKPGVYYVGIRGATTEDMNYTLISRGIGDGLSIPVQELNFSGGMANASVAARDAAFFKVVIPTNTPSWKLDLSPATDSEVALVVAKDAVPNILANSTSSGTNAASPGRKMQKLGAEHYLLLPPPGQTSLHAGTYYIAAISEGQNPLSGTSIGGGNSTFTLTSVGTLPQAGLGTVSPIVDLVQSGSVAGGETVAYQFTVPPGTLSVEARLENRVGNPVMVLRSAAKLPDPGMTVPGGGADTYGNEGGEVIGTDISATFINAANPTPGTYFVLVKGRSVGTAFTNASFTLRLNSIGAAAVNFNDDSVSITNHAVGTWKYFVIDVPTNALGWDVRLANVTAGLPRIVVRRDALPNSLTTPAWSSPGSAPTWPSSNQWAAGPDWTRRANSSDGLVIEDGRILAMGMGRPLQPGTYYVGVINTTGSTNTMSYQLLSRGMGAGFSIPVVDLPFNGSVTNLILSAREAAYYRVVVPSNTPSWKVKLNVTGGEAMLAGLFNWLPNVDSVLAGNTLATGKGMQKAGNEQFLQLPVVGQTNIPAGTNYFVVVGEGVNPASGTRIGTGSSSFVLKSMGALPVTDLGMVASSDIEQIDGIEGGEARAYQFTVPPGTLGVEVRLEDRIGNPVLVVRPDASLPNPGGSFGPVQAETYGNEGGFVATDANPTLLTIPNPIAGTYTLMVKARALGTVYSDASYRLRIREVLSPVLNFSTSDNTNGLANIASGVLENNQRAFFKVIVPSNYMGSPVLGWKLDVSQSSGLASLRVRKDVLPSDAFSGMPSRRPPP